ncbi:MAG: leucine-rich repeat domain-containing protein [Treponema sp.]|nr:leucine-rich repeat domain-containing protein [Treponema sp.]
MKWFKNGLFMLVIAVLLALLLTGCKREKQGDAGNTVTGNIIIPYGVTRIGNHEFADAQITGVTIPDSVTFIGDEAFMGNQLTGVTIPDSVTFIGYRAFMGNLLTEITIPGSVTSIAFGAFISNQLTIITIGSDVNLLSPPGYPDVFDDGFDHAYNAAGKAAGTYILRDGVWSRQTALEFAHNIQFNNQTISITVYATWYTDDDYGTLDNFTFEYRGKKHNLMLSESEIGFYFTEQPDLDDLFWITDFNFDNYMDIAIYSSAASGTSNLRHKVYMYNPPAQEFYHHEELSDMSHLSVDTENKIISEFGKGGHAGLIYVFAQYKWENEELSPIHSERQDYDYESELYIRTTRTLQNGSWTEQIETFRDEDLY